MKKKITIDRVIEITEAVQLISQNDLLSGETNYWLSKLSNQLKTRYKSFMYARESKRLEILSAQTELMDKKPAEWRIKLSQLDAEFVKFAEDLKQKIAKEEAKREKEISYEVRAFKLSEFMAADEIKRTRIIDQKPVELNIKKGDSLVTLQFFELMGDLIE